MKYFSPKFVYIRKPAILKVVMPYAEALVPVTNTIKFPRPFSELYNPSMLTADYHDLLKECDIFYYSGNLILKKNLLFISLL